MNVNKPRITSSPVIIHIHSHFDHQVQHKIQVMSNQSLYPIQDTNQCTDMDAWWNMITSVYNFLSASTNLAQTLDNKYSKYPIISQTPLLIELPIIQQETFLIEEFPWFLDLLAGSNHEELLPNNGIISDEEVRNYCEFSPERLTAVLTYAQPNNAEQLTSEKETENIGDGFDIRKAIESMYSFENSFINAYIENHENVLTSMIENQHSQPETQSINSKSKDSYKSALIFHDHDGGISTYASCATWQSDSDKTMTSLKDRLSEELNNGNECKRERITRMKHEKIEETVSEKFGVHSDSSNFQSCINYDDHIDFKEVIHCPSIETKVISKSTRKRLENNQKTCKKCRKDTTAFVYGEQLAMEAAISEEVQICTNKKDSSITFPKTGESTTVQEPIKIASSETRHLKQCLLKQQKPKEKLQKRQSETIPKNIDELKEQLHCIRNKVPLNQSRMRKPQTPVQPRLPDAPRAEEPVVPTKPEEYTIYTANVIQQNSAITTKKTNRYDAVESVVKKFINGAVKPCSTIKEVDYPKSTKKGGDSGNGASKQRKVTSRSPADDKECIPEAPLSSADTFIVGLEEKKSVVKKPQLRSKSVDNNSVDRKTIPCISNTQSSTAKKQSSARPSIGAPIIVRSKPPEENIHSKSCKVKSGALKNSTSAVKNSKILPATLEEKCEKPVEHKKTEIPRKLISTKKRARQHI